MYQWGIEGAKFVCTLAPPAVTFLLVMMHDSFQSHSSTSSHPISLYMTVGKVYAASHKFDNFKNSKTSFLSPPYFSPPCFVALVYNQKTSSDKFPFPLPCFQIGQSNGANSYFQVRDASFFTGQEKKHLRVSWRSYRLKWLSDHAFLYTLF